MRPQARNFVASLESLKGARIDEETPAPLPSRDGMLQAIFADRPMGSVAPSPGDGDLPASLSRFVGMRLADVPWRMVMPGVKGFVVEDHDGVEATLYWIKAGAKMPHHTHEGDEVTLVLRGGFSDVSGHYARGDVAVADGDVDHRPVADDDGEDCICFAVTTAPVRLTGPVGKIIQSIFRN